MGDRLDSFNQIALAAERGQTAVVVELCKKHLKEFPDDGFTWVIYGSSQKDLALYAEAEKSLRRAIRTLPRKALHHAYTKLGHLSKAKGEFAKAALWYRRALKLVPNDAGHYIFLADNAFQQGRLRLAETLYRNALKCTDGCLDEAFYNLGGILLGRGNYSEAIKCYEQALKIDPKYTPAKKRLDDANLARFISQS